VHPRILIFPAHPWVREGGEALEIPIDISVLNNMRQFVKYSRLKQFALRVRKDKLIQSFACYKQWNLFDANFLLLDYRAGIGQHTQ